MYLLGTNVISELRRIKLDGGVVAWLETCRDAELNIAAPTIGEIQSGIERTRVTDAKKAVEIERWLAKVIATFKIASSDTEVFQEWARLMHGQPREHIIDGLIAATANVHKYTVVTRNVRDFKRFKVATLNPFESRTR